MAPTSISTNKSKSSSKKRKIQEEVETKVDSRFTFAEEDLDDETNETAAVVESESEEEEEESEDLGDALAGPSTSTSTLPTETTTKNSNPLPAHLLPSKGKIHGIPGLIYLSRLPPGMGPSKVKHLLSAYGEVGRVFLARADKDPPQNLSSHKRQKDKHREHKFAEGWIEFMDKRVARSVAEMLNANVIGGKKGSRWRDDVWTMKYLPRFRWDMLSEQVALERATQTSLLRFHLQHSRTEQESYLSAVEKNRVKTAIETKAEGRREGKRLKGDISTSSVSAGSGAGAIGGEEGEKKVKKERERSYRQREVLDLGEKKEKKVGSKAELDSVLGRLF